MMPLLSGPMIFPGGVLPTGSVLPTTGGVLPTTGVCFLLGVCAAYCGGVLPTRCCLLGVCFLLRMCVLPTWGLLPTRWAVCHLPPPHGQAKRCKIITLPQFRWRAVIILLEIGDAFEFF